MIFSVNVTKSAANCGFGHVYWRNPSWKTSFFVQCTGWVSISAFSSFVGIPIEIPIYAKGLKICLITAGIKKYRSIIKKKKHGETLPLAKSKANNAEVSISKALIDSNISQDEFVLINNVPKELHDMKEEVENSNEN